MGLTGESANRGIGEGLECGVGKVDRLGVDASGTFISDSNSDLLAVVQVGDLNLLAAVSSAIVNSRV